MRTIGLGILLLLLISINALASETLTDFFGPVDSINVGQYSQQSNSRGEPAVRGLGTIQVLGRTFPLHPTRLKVSRSVTDRGRDHFVPSSLSEVRAGINVTLVMSGHSVVEIIIER